MRDSATLRVAAAVLAGAAMLVGTACGNSGSESETTASTAPKDTGERADASGGDITALCGDEELTIAYAKSSPPNSWARLAHAEFEAEAKKCPNIKTEYKLAGGNQQQAISNLNAFVAQGVDGLIVQADTGPAELPAISAAQKAGVKTVTYLADPGGEIGVDVEDKVLFDYPAIGKAWADWLAKNVKKGNVAFLGGPAGAQSSKQFFDGLKAGLEQYPDLKLTPDRVVDGNWDPATKRRVVPGLIAKYGKIDAIVSDYTASDTGTMEAFKAAGEELPALVGTASSNGIGCLARKEGFPYFSVDGTTALPRLALRKSLAAITGIENPEPSVVTLPVFIDTEGGKPAACEPSLPVDADLSAGFTPDEMAQILK